MLLNLYWFYPPYWTNMNGRWIFSFSVIYFITKMYVFHQYDNIILHMIIL